MSFNVFDEMGKLAALMELLCSLRRTKRFGPKLMK
jgi:hypothetical protein